MLADRARIFIRSGNGGNGSASFRREKFVPRGGPDGGDGGRGGDVRLRARPNLSSLLAFQFNEKFTAEHGGPGLSKRRHGKSARPLTIDVPVGTVIWDDETGEMIADLTEADASVLIAEGGRGGLGNVHFKSSTRQAPRIAELGEPGKERWLRLELRLIADVGLVGLPNGGKSTLLRAASAARPKVADYPFTTIEPHLGVVEIGGPGGQVFVIADIPGLIKGAAEGSGLGHEFLRHVTRTEVLVHVLDASGGLEGRDPLTDFKIINAELEAYDESMTEKPMLVALNKMDLAEARDRLPALRQAIEAQGFATFPISGATGEGVPALLQAVGATLKEAQERNRERAAAEERQTFTLPAQDERAWEATRLSKHNFAVTGIGIDRFTKMTDFANDESVDRFQQTLSSSGITAELTRQGIVPGDIVHIGNQELTWGEEHELEELDTGGNRRRR